MALGQPIHVLQRTVPLSEIRLWRAYFDKQPNIHTKHDYYLAQIAAEVRQNRVKGRVRVKDLLLDFRPPSFRKRMSVEEMKKRVKMWLSGLSHDAKANKGKK